MTGPEQKSAETVEKSVEETSKPGMRRGRKRRRAGVTTLPSDQIPPFYAQLFIVSIAAIVLYFVVLNPNRKPLETLLLATLVLVTACLPMLRYLRQGQFNQVPVLESHGLFYALCFGWPGFLALPDLTEIRNVNEVDMQKALLATFCGLLALYSGYYLLGPNLFKGTRRPQNGRTITSETFAWLAWCGCAAGLALKLVSHHSNSTGGGTGGIGQIATMIYQMGFFGLLALALSKQVGILSRIAVFIFLLPLAILLNSGLSTGQLAGAVTLIGWISLMVMRTKKRVPVELLVCAFLFFLIFQPVKFYVREMAWTEGINLGPVETIEAYAQGFRETYGSANGLLIEHSEAFGNSFSRINHLATTAAVIRDTPSQQPFLWGSSYIPILTKWIPRAIWPNKPAETLGNEWAKRYGYLGANDTTTSFNLPWLPEMFMNFGWYGIIGVMLLIGIFYRYLWVVLFDGPEMPVKYTIALVMAQSLVFTESNFSLQVGSLIIFVMLLWFLGKCLEYAGISSGPNFKPGDSSQNPHTTSN